MTRETCTIVSHAAHPETQALQGSVMAAQAPHHATLLLQCGPPHALLQRRPSLPFIYSRGAGRVVPYSRALTGKLGSKLDIRMVYSR